MSGHERERLSAYLDGELDPADRAAIEAHLTGCAECRGVLAELAAVDVAARALPAEAPPGYFESLPARVRGRIEAAGARWPAARWRLPAWTWAAAAALILAVITPITLWHPRARVASSPAAGPPREAVETYAAPPPTPQRPAAVPAAPEAPAPGRAGGMASRETPAKERKAELEEARRSIPVASAPLEPVSPPETAAPPESVGVLAPTPRPAEAASAPFAAEGAVADRSASTAEVQALGGAAAPPRPDTAKAMRPAGVGARAARESAPAPPSTEPTDAEQAYRALAAERPHEGEGWRRLREAWRAFARTHASHPLGDEARVRVVETGVEAWRVGADPADLARVREDAAAYLSRRDAAQAARVRALLEGLPAGPP